VADIELKSAIATKQQQQQLTRHSIHFNVIVKFLHLLVAIAVPIPNTGTDVAVPTQIRVPRHVNTTGLQQVVDAASVLEQFLLVQVVDEKRFAQRHVLFRLVEGIALAEKGNQHIHHGPLVNGLIQNAVVTKKDHLKD